MMYAINTRTKAHILMQDEAGWDGAVVPGSDGGKWRLTVADADGWIPWRGGKCPMPDLDMCETKDEAFPEEDGQPYRARDIHWGPDTTIIAYRPVLNASAEPEPPARDGEGLPPVGVDCEVYEDASWHFATIVAHHDGCAIAAIHRDDMRYEYGAYCGGAIRPIRSEEGRAVEEMVDVMREVDGVFLTGRTQESIARALCRAGYRKQEAAS